MQTPQPAHHSAHSIRASLIQALQGYSHLQLRLREVTIQREKVEAFLKTSKRPIKRLEE